MDSCPKKGFRKPEVLQKTLISALLPLFFFFEAFPAMYRRTKRTKRTEGISPPSQAQRHTLSTCTVWTAVCPGLSFSFRTAWLPWWTCPWWTGCWRCSTVWGHRGTDGRRRPPCCYRPGGSAGSPWSLRPWRCCRCRVTSGYSGTESGNTCRTERRHRRRETMTVGLGE